MLFTTAPIYLSLVRLLQCDRPVCFMHNLGVFLRRDTPEVEADG
jgi:hypothetical protein